MRGSLDVDPIHSVPYALGARKAGQVPATMGRGTDFFGPWALGSSHGDRVF